MSSSKSYNNNNKNKAPLTQQPQRNFFDQWNSASTGHQVSESSLSRSTGWRQTRTQKLGRQFGNSGGGGAPAAAAKVVPGLAGEGGSVGKDEWKWMSETDARRMELGCEDIRAFMGGERKRKRDDGGGGDGRERKRTGFENVHSPSPSSEPKTADSASAAAKGNNTQKEKSISISEPSSSTTTKSSTSSGSLFAGLTFYINGSTAPLISDHKLKHVLASNGASIAITLGRRSVTHVILGTPSSSSSRGAGGGLAAGKLQKEIMKSKGGVSGGAGVKFVGVEWVLESLKANKRLPESRFANLHIAPKGQRSVATMFAKKGE